MGRVSSAWPSPRPAATRLKCQPMKSNKATVKVMTPKADRAQVELLDLSRSSVYYEPRAISDRDLVLMRRLDEPHLQGPVYGSRKLAAQLQREAQEVGRRHVTTLMRRMGIEAMYRRPRTSIPARGATIYPYLLSGLTVD